MSQAVAPLRIARFRALWIASIFSNVGSFLQAVAGSWLMLELTGSATWVGLMVASTTLPLLFLALAAGAVADLANRGRVLLVSQTLMGLAAAGMALLSALDLVTPGRLLTLSLLLGVGVAFNLPAWQAMVPDLVPRGMVASAVALNSVAFNVARAVGPALGGLIVATAGPELAFSLNALSYLGVIIVLAALTGRFTIADQDGSSVANAIANGVRFARFTPPFRRLLLLAALFAMTSSVVQSVLPSRTEELGGSAGTYGLLLGAMGLGALIGAFTRQAVVETLEARSVPITITLFGLAGIGTGLAQTPAWAVVPLLVAGATWVWTLTTTNATAQLMSPEWVRGRAMSLYSLAFVGVLPLGSIVAGVLADLVGAGNSMIVLSVGSVALGIAAPRFEIPALADVEMPEFSGERTADGHVATEGGPVMIVNTWLIDGRRLDEFLTVMSEVRLVRLRTGAYRWRLYRNASDPHRLSEVFLTVSWEEHLAQHRRIDDVSAGLIRHARSFAEDDGPITRHLVAVDVEHPEDWEPLLAAHDEYHRNDGSIPLSTD
ncbi:MAG: MFS transporter [Acidimicrobiia bacterium]|nr:MFS transporter [Acidimicrobiia bacterium]